MNLSDFATGAIIEGATVTIEGASTTSDSSGNASVDITKNTTSEATISATGYLTTHLWLAADEAGDWSLNFGLASSALIGAVESGFGITYDTTLSTVIVSALQSDGAGGWEPAAGATIELDVAYQGAVHQGPSGFAPGNMLEEGGATFVAFANTAVGTVNVTVTPPAGSVGCVTFASGSRLDNQIVTYASELSSVVFLCM